MCQLVGGEILEDLTGSRGPTCCRCERFWSWPRNAHPRQCGKSCPTTRKTFHSKVASRRSCGKVERWIQTKRCARFSNIHLTKAPGEKKTRRLPVVADSLQNQQRKIKHIRFPPNWWFGLLVWWFRRGFPFSLYQNQGSHPQTTFPTTNSGLPEDMYRQLEGKGVVLCAEARVQLKHSMAPELRAAAFDAALRVQGVRHNHQPRACATPAACATVWPS